MVSISRSVALEVLKRVSTQGAFASSALRSAFERGDSISSNDRALATELVYGVLRRRGELDRALKKSAGKRLKDLDPQLHDILRLGAYQLIALDRVPPHAIVSEAVEQAKKRRGKRGAATTNAILRKMSQAEPETRVPAPPALGNAPVAHIAALGNVCHDLAQRLVDDLGASEALDYLQACAKLAPLTLRANALQTTPQALAAEVGGQRGAGPFAVRLPSALGGLPAQLPAVLEGRATPQDEASMRVVELLDPQPGERILDVCAAPGGKSTYMAERMGNKGELLAYDRLPKRLARVAQSAERLGLSIIETVEVLPPPAPEFDRVLVDAPCSGLGTLRRHPEIRWRFRNEDLPALARTQAQVLQEGLLRLKPGGTLVYSVCTVTKMECEAQLEALGAPFEVEAQLRLAPHQEGAPDGFFAAKIRRRAEN